MLAIRGAGSAIARALVAMPSVAMAAVAVRRDQAMPLDARRYLFCAGVLIGKSAGDMTDAERSLTRWVNHGQVVADCDRIIAENDRARICVIGSESGFAGSFDETYAEAKARLHNYVQGKRLRTPDQQLVAIAPSIVADAGMTLRRKDVDRLERKRLAHPKRRFLLAAEIARLIHHVLYVDEGYLSGIVIRMNGGAHVPPG